VSQVDGDHSPIMKELRDEMLCSSGTSLKSPRNDRPISTPTPSPEEWLAPALPTPITVFQAARIGSGGLGANVGWARHDVADATFTVPGRQNELSLRAGSTWIVVPQIKMPAKPGPCLT
jgi:hypothetical protein